MHELKLEQVRRIDLHDSYAYTTHIQLYERCKRQYLFFRKYGFESANVGEAAALGNLVHAIAEEIHQAIMRGTELDELGSPDWIRARIREISGSDPFMDAVAEQAYIHVTRYIQLLAEWSPKVLGAELQVQAAERGYLLNGKVDAVFQRDGGSLHVLDIKTGAYPDTEEKLEPFRKQLYLYAYMLKRKYGESIQALHLFFSGEPSGQGLLSLETDEKSVQRAMSEMNETIAAIRLHRFELGEYPLAECEYCSFQSFCRTLHAATAALSDKDSSRGA